MISAVIGHLVGDYLLQNDWMALNKKARIFPCAVHATLWTVAVASFAGWWSHPQVVGLLWCAHFLQDHTNIISHWMNLIGQRQFASGPCAPWSIIVVENTCHLLTIWAAWRWLA